MGDGMGSKGKENGIDMLNGPLLGKILAFALPLAVTSIMQQLFNSADAAVAGRFVSGDDLAAIGATTPIINLFISLFVGLSIGANVLAAMHIARKDDARVHDAVQTSMVVALAGGLVLVVVGFLAARPMLVAIDTPGNVLDAATRYLTVYFCGMPFFLVYNFASALLRSKGDSKRPLYALSVACVANVVLNLAFTIVLPWGITGVALGTVLANGISCTMVVAFLLREPGALRLDPRGLRPERASLAFIMKIGVPAGVQGAVFALSNLVIQSALNGFGSDAMAGSTAALNYECFTYFLVNAFAQTAVTFVGQNFAAKRYGRVKRIFALCLVCALVSAAALSAVCVAFASPLIGLFAADASAVAFGVIRMWHVEVLEFVPAFYEVPAGVMRGMGHSTVPAIITLVGSCLLRLVWVATAFQANPTFETLMTVYPVTWTVTGVAMLATYVIVRRKALRA